MGRHHRRRHRSRTTYVVYRRSGAYRSRYSDTIGYGAVYGTGYGRGYGTVYGSGYGRYGCGGYSNVGWY